MRLKDIVQEWVDFAAMDLSAARFLMQMIPQPLEIIGFHCQQAIEKYLKAYLVANGVEPEKTHDLMQLQKSCTVFDPSFSSLSPVCSTLSAFAVRTRYPLRRDILDAREVQKFLTASEESGVFIAEKIKRILGE